MVDVESFLREVRDLLEEGSFEFTAKASRELVDIPVDVDEAVAILESIAADDFYELQRGHEGDDLYVFIVDVLDVIGLDLTLYIKLFIDNGYLVVVVSFHEEGA